MRSALRLLVLLAIPIAVAGCGGDEAPRDPVERVPASIQDEVRAAARVDPSAFPKPAGRSLGEIAAEFETGSGTEPALATSVFRVGTNRLAFGVLDPDLRFVYGRTVVYLEHSDGGKVAGPVAAPADVLVTDPRYRSRQAATEEDPFAAVYAAEVELDRTGVWNALVVSDLGGGRRIAAEIDFEVVSRREDRIPDVGEKAPRVPTDTIASARGDVELVDTRVPPAEELHRRSFEDVVGRKPVALLFATPQLCQSRVCGPVVDVALQLRAKYGDRVEFIHQEVFEDNQVDKGLRPPLQRFNLRTEPWLFTVGADGTIAARLEGSFGLAAFEEAVRAAL